MPTKKTKSTAPKKTVASKEKKKPTRKKAASPAKSPKAKAQAEAVATIAATVVAASSNEQLRKTKKKSLLQWLGI